MKKIILCIYSMFFGATVFSQSMLDSILDAVQANNKAIQSNYKYWDAQKTGFKTGLTPYDPQVEYDYMIGSPAAAGNQRDFAITQRMDFPTTYKKKRSLSKEQAAQADLQHNVFRQEILLNAKLVWLELIYLNKRSTVLQLRERKTAQLVQDYQKKLDQGEVIILDVNKARIQLLNIQNDLALTQNQRDALLTRLTELNGGIAIDSRDTSYPESSEIADFETLDSLIEANDPVIKTYEQDKVILKQQVAVQKALNLPKIEAGYHSQGILGQSYKGIHAGITVPLWENKKKVRAAEMNLDYAISNAEAQILEHRLENKQVYDQLAVRKKAMEDFVDLMSNLNNISLLDKALRLGQITVIQYFLDESYFYSTYDKYLQMELEYQQAVAKLYKFLL